MLGYLAAAPAAGSAVSAATAQPETTARAPSPAAACRPAKVLDKWSLERRAAQLVVVPVEEDAVLSVRSLVAGGAGGVILFGSDAPSTMPADLAALRVLDVPRLLAQDGSAAPASPDRLGLSRAALYRRMEKHGL